MATIKTVILKLIENCEERGDFYIFDNREDFVESRTSWDDLKDTSENLYYLIKNIKELLKS